MAQDCITIKGTRGGLLILVDASRDFNELRANLAAKFTAARGFFQGASFALLPTTPLSSQAKAELEAICREHGLVPGADIALPLPPRSRGNKEKFAVTGTLEEAVYTPVPAVEPSIPTQPLTSEAAGLPTLLEEGNLRNGQELTCSGHIVLVGNVHQGATLKAGGNILV
ncbi:MAG: hypothetical protein H5T99_13045, partial [Moorella sp. (in: Bacteria)]|nr:hypothetical protein [Moorella sp. (in: firmicutes)]